MATVANLDVNLRANTRQFSTGMDRAAKQTAGFSSKILSLGKKGAGAFIAIGAAAAKVLAKGVFDQFTEIDNLAKQADRLKITTEALAGLRLGAEKSGVEIQALESSLRRMLRRVSEASKGTGSAAKAIQELGLNAQQLNQLSSDQQLKAFADALNKVGNESDQLRLAFSIFDTEGAKMISLLRSRRLGMPVSFSCFSAMMPLLTPKRGLPLQPTGPEWCASRFGNGNAWVTQELLHLVDGRSAFQKTGRRRGAVCEVLSG